MACALLIDDDASNVDFMRSLLRLEGHDLVWAVDGRQGLEMARQHRPDLIICDVIMPHLGGYAVLETLRGDPQLSAVPVVLFSAAMTAEARELGLRRGANEVLFKPFDLKQLRNAIRLCLGQAPQ